MPLEIVTSVVSVGTINQIKDISKKFSAIQFPLLRAVFLYTLSKNICKRCIRSNTLPLDLTLSVAHTQTTICDNSKNPTNFTLTPLP